jgi:hypothetical protein
MAMAHPERVEAQKTRLRDQVYRCKDSLYERKSQWDTNKKKAKKKIGKYLGAITPESFKPKKHRRQSLLSVLLRNTASPHLFASIARHTKNPQQGIP